MSLINLKSFLPTDTIFDLRYGTSNNIAGQILYRDHIPQLQEKVAKHLLIAAKQLEAGGLRLVVWDAYRPQEVHLELLAINSDQHYILNESNHPKGLAVDVTLADSTGVYLDMGTDFDEFSESAHIDYKGLSTEQANNRLMLAQVMQNAGFIQWPYEWWHFDYPA